MQLMLVTFPLRENPKDDDPLYRTRYNKDCGECSALSGIPSFPKDPRPVLFWSTAGTLVTCHVHMFQAVGAYSDRKCPGHVEVVLFVFLLAGLNLVLLYIYNSGFIFTCEPFCLVIGAIV